MIHILNHHRIGKQEYGFFSKRMITLICCYVHCRNVARPNSQFELATRFIALASVGNASKEKFIYALNVTAVDKMRVTDLIQKTTDEIPCPYDSMKFSIGGAKLVDSEQGNQYFYDFNEQGQHQHRKRGGKFNQGGDHQQKRPRQPNFDQGTDKFCLTIYSLY